jgi:hypothetical protein
MINKERWHTASLAFQLGNIGSEICRARLSIEQNDAAGFKSSLERAFDLIDLTRSDPRLRERLKEICRLREVLADWYVGAKQYNISLESLENFCTQMIYSERTRT